MYREEEIDEEKERKESEPVTVVNPEPGGCSLAGRPVMYLSTQYDITTEMDFSTVEWCTNSFMPRLS